MSNTLQDLRQNYTRDQLELDHEETPRDPFKFFTMWLDDAKSCEQIIEPNAMTLATSSSDGAPSARIVLLKGFGDDGFIFYTNSQSQKGRQLKDNPLAALVFWWSPLERQVRVEGRVSKVSPEVSDAYFQSRPRSSQLGAWSSPQSQEISARDLLSENFKHYSALYQTETIPRPPHWGGYQLRPHRFEFWQGRESRLHDRLAFSLEGDAWRVGRLAP